jgi:hypothetical protein
MGKVYETIDEKVGAWIERQHLFFVATAPLAADGPRIADSCGYGVPLMCFDGKRGQYDGWVDKKVRDGGFDEYIAEKNAVSIDGLPAI